jgi:outer membrane immunogenic protein
MNKIFVAAVGAFAVSAMQPAFAADMPVKAPRMVETVYDWTGWYIGANGGYSWGRSDTTAAFFNNTTGAFISTSSSRFKLNGPIAGGQVGYNHQSGRWVWGIEVDGQWSGQDGGTNFLCAPTAGLVIACNNVTFGPGLGVSPTASFSQSLEWFVTARLRLGMTVTPTVLAYVTGGLAVGKIETNGVLAGFTAASVPTSAPFAYDKVKSGWTVGGGIESHLSGNWTGKIEYIFADYGSVSGSGTLLTAAIPLRAQFRSDIIDHVIRVGLNYRWHRAVVARN